MHDDRLPFDTYVRSDNNNSSSSLFHRLIGLKSNMSRDELNDFLVSTLDTKGACADSLLIFVSVLNNIDAGKPIQRHLAWLRKVRQFDSVASKPRSVDEGPSRIHNIFLPCHLPVSPVPEAAPKSGLARLRWTARRSAWELTEWIVAALNYYSMSCPKSPNVYAQEFGS